MGLLLCCARKTTKMFELRALHNIETHYFYLFSEPDHQSEKVVLRILVDRLQNIKIYDDEINNERTDLIDSIEIDPYGPQSLGDQKYIFSSLHSLLQDYFGTLPEQRYCALRPHGDLQNLSSLRATIEWYALGNPENTAEFVEKVLTRAQGLELPIKYFVGQSNFEEFSQLRKTLRGLLLALERLDEIDDNNESARGDDDIVDDNDETLRRKRFYTKKFIDKLWDDLDANAFLAR